MTQQWYVSGFGLRISLPEPWEGLDPAEPGAVDVTIQYGEVPTQLHTPATRLAGLLPQWWVEVGSHGEILVGAAVCRLLVRHGNQITIYAHANAETSLIRYHLFYRALPLLLQQRGILVLHANTVALPGGAVAISGQTGAGKSTLLLALLQRGGQLLADDVSPYAQGQDGRAWAFPGYRSFNLCQDTLAHFDTPGITIRPIYGPRSKVSVVPFPHQIAPHPQPLRQIILLHPSQQDEVQVQPLTGQQKFHMLHQQSYVNHLTAPHSLLFETLGIVSQVPVLQVFRPINRWTIDELVELCTTSFGSVPTQNLATPGCGY